MAEHVLQFHPARPARQPLRPLEKAGLWLRRHRRLIAASQWIILVFYSFLVIVPAFTDFPDQHAHIWNNLRLFAQFCFWGIWWPGVMITTVLFGRVWCGLFCPEGLITETASKYGLGKSVPGWLKWPGWPLLAFVTITLYGQLISVYEYPEAALLILGGSSLAAALFGFVYGREKRIWCRYLCPASGVFSLLARLSPLHYKVNRLDWDRAPKPAEAVNCAPLVDIRRMTGASECHACGRCAGQKGAVQLAWRSPFAEILDRRNPPRSAEALTLLFGVLGVATAAFQWTVSPWFLRLKLTTAEWLVENGHFALLDNNAPWWLLTHYPQASDLFSWLDGLLVMVYILCGGFLLGLCLALAPFLGSRLLKSPVAGWQRLALCLTPMAAVNVILGLSMLTLTQLKAEFIVFSGLPAWRMALLATGCLASSWLTARLLVQTRASALRSIGTWLLMLWPLALLATLWSLVFFFW